VRGGWWCRRTLRLRSGQAASVPTRTRPYTAPDAVFDPPATPDDISAARNSNNFSHLPIVVPRCTYILVQRNVPAGTLLQIALMFLQEHFQPVTPLDPCSHPQPQPNPRSLDCARRSPRSPACFARDDNVGSEPNAVLQYGNEERCSPVLLGRRTAGGGCPHMSWCHIAAPLFDRVSLPTPRSSRAEHVGERSEPTCAVEGPCVRLRHRTEPFLAQ